MTGEHSARLKFHFVQGPYMGASVTLKEVGFFVLGRSKQAAIPLTNDPDAPHLSGIIEISPDGEFLHAQEAITLNGEVVTRQKLASGDVIRTGQSALEVEIVPNSWANEGVSSTTSFDAELRTVVAKLAKTENGSTLYLPGFVLGQMLGSGQMGTVYLARREGSAEKLAIKIAHAEAFDDERKVQLFLREASVLSQLQHKRIVRFMEVSSVGRQFFLVMEYVPTIDLQAILREQPTPARIRTACSLVCQVLEGLRHAHELGLVHRDIKPTNILVSRTDRKLSSKLADFGLAKSYVNSGAGGITRTGEVRGTLDYMPPEQLQDSRVVGPAADVYSIGATLYYLLSDRHPLPRNNRSEAIRAILEDEPEPLHLIVRGIPPALSKIVQKSLRKDPQERFPSAREMRSALGKFLNPEE